MTAKKPAVTAPIDRASKDSPPHGRNPVTRNQGADAMPARLTCAACPSGKIPAIVPNRQTRYAMTIDERIANMLRYFRRLMRLNAKMHTTTRSETGQYFAALNCIAVGASEKPIAMIVGPITMGVTNFRITETRRVYPITASAAPPTTSAPPMCPMTAAGPASLKAAMMVMIGGMKLKLDPCTMGSPEPSFGCVWISVATPMAK